MWFAFNARYKMRSLSFVVELDFRRLAERRSRLRLAQQMSFMHTSVLDKHVALELKLFSIHVLGFLNRG